MAQPKMGRRAKRLYRGLLGALFFLAFPLAAQDNALILSDGPKSASQPEGGRLPALIEIKGYVTLGAEGSAELAIIADELSEPLDLWIGDRLSIVIQFSGAGPSAIRPKTPQLPPGLSENGITVKPYLNDKGSENRSPLEKSLLEWRLTALNAGTYQLPPLTVEVESRKITLALPELFVINTLTAKGESESTTKPKTRVWWDLSEETLYVGEASIVSLMLDSVQEGNVSAAPGEDYLLERLTDHKAGPLIAAVFRLIPLKAGLICLPEAGFHRDDGTVLIAAPRPLQVLDRVKAVKTVHAGAVLTETVHAEAPMAPSPEASGDYPQEGQAWSANEDSWRSSTVAIQDVFPEAPSLYKAFFSKEAKKADVAWREGLYEQAIGILRAYERDGSLWFLIRPLRREAEAALGLEGSADEHAAPFYPIIGLILFCLASGSVLANRWFRLRSIKASSVTFRGSNGLVYIVVLLFFIATAAFCYLIVIRSERPAISAGALAYSIPEETGGRTSFFPLGSRVVIKGERSAWVYVVGDDGTEAWLRGIDVYRY